MLLRWSRHQTGSPALLMAAQPAKLALHQHGKSRVRLGRVWRQGDGEFYRHRHRWRQRSTSAPFIYMRLLSLAGCQMARLCCPEVYNAAVSRCSAPCSLSRCHIHIRLHLPPSSSILFLHLSAHLCRVRCCDYAGIRHGARVLDRQQCRHDCHRHSGERARQVPGGRQ